MLLAGVVPVAGVSPDAPRATVDAPQAAADVANANAIPNANATQYKVSLDNVTVRTWLLRNATVLNATVEEVVVENVSTPDGGRENVTITNATLGRFDVERGRLLNVTATRLIVRNRSVLDVPGGDLFDPNVQNRTLDRQWTRNTTVAGVVIDRIAVDAAVLCENASLGQQADDPSAFDPTADDQPPAITVQNGSAEEALIMRGQAANWSVESVDEPSATNASLPQACNRG